MLLPRWTVYPALAVIAGTAFIALPRKSSRDPYVGATAAKSVVVLGIDGMDPEILAQVIAKYPDRMENFRWLIAQADGIQPLQTSTPPQSPVAWSNFITGMNPGGHGIFDFIHRDPVTRVPCPATTRTEAGFTLHLPGPYKVDIGADSPSNRTGTPFWRILQEKGIPADVWRIPVNFPVEPSEGVSFSGMMTPTLDSAYGECTFYTSDAKQKTQLRYKKTEQLQEDRGTIVTGIQGPANPCVEGNPNVRFAFKMYVDRDADAAVIVAGTTEDAPKVVLRPGEWSDFVKLRFDILPLGMMQMDGICRFYLRAIEPNVELYASPVNFDPESPPAPVSEPETASGDVVKAIGRYYTQGMAEDVNALKTGVLNDSEFMQQVTLVHHETMDMLGYALDRYVENGRGGMLFFYFSEIDLASHMMWRHGDDLHPAHDAGLARQDASAWTGREGSTLADTVADMYLRLDPALGLVRKAVGDNAVLFVMSDHGFAPYAREFSLNTWLCDNGYLVLRDGVEKELRKESAGFHEVAIFGGNVDWTKTRAYGVGFNSLYLNLKGRELDDPHTEGNEAGIVESGPEADALLLEIKGKLEAAVDETNGRHPVYRCDLSRSVYSGQRLAEAPDMIVGYDSGYGNSDASSTGRIPNEILIDNKQENHAGKLGTFNGNHLMHPDVVPGVVISNRPLRPGAHALEDITVEVLRQFNIDPLRGMNGKPVLE